MKEFQVVTTKHRKQPWMCAFIQIILCAKNRDRVHADGLQFSKENSPTHHLSRQCINVIWDDQTISIEVISEPRREEQKSLPGLAYFWSPSPSIVQLGRREHMSCCQNLEPTGIDLPAKTSHTPSSFCPAHFEDTCLCGYFPSQGSSFKD